MTNDRLSAASSFSVPDSEEGFLTRWSRNPGRWRWRLNLPLFALLSVAVIAAAQLFEWPASSNLQVQAGAISQVDILAPRSLTYQSEILTAEERDRAAGAIAKIYDPPQTRVARQQIARAELALNFIQKVRLDPYARAEQKIEWLNTISDVSLTAEQAARILELSDDEWADVAAETTRVLDEAMRSVIREGEIQSAQRTVPSLIGFRLNDNEAAVVSVLVQGLLRPNTFFNAARTDAARQEAADQVKPVDKTIAAGETILRKGDKIDPLDIEVLDVLGLLRPQRSWRDYLAAALQAMLITGLIAAFITQRRRDFWSDNLRVFLLGSIFLTFAVLAKLMTPMTNIVPYLYPLAAMTMLVGSLIGLPMAVMATALIGVLLLDFTGGNPELVVYPVMSAIAGAMALGQADRLNSFVKAGFWIIAINLLTLLIFRLPLLGVTDNRSMLELATAGVLNGIFASSFTLVIFYLLGQVFGLTTSLQLLELSRPTHPLLRQLLLKAPGTYHHTLLVGNMTEEAATAVGADALLGRVGSYYHDIGKTVRPYFFIENNTDGVNPHDRLDPYTSARIIISHVTDGVDLAQKFNLPESIIDFIREHHGSTRVEYFYHQACQEHEDPDEVDENEFRYPGPRPRSRETAILMLADGCEATVRAVSPPSRAEMVELIRSVINRRLMSGQLDDSQLTLRDLNEIADAFVRVLQGIHHPRVKYPGETNNAAPSRQTAQPAQPATAPAK